MAKAQLKFDDNDLLGAAHPFAPVYSLALVEEIINQIANGGTLLRICEKEGMPNRQTFHEWLKKKDGLQARYDEAVKHRTEMYVEQITDISDDGLNDTYIDEKTGERKVIPDVVARSKLRVDSRKWIASKLIPHKYGDKTEITGANGTPLIPEGNDTETARRVAFLLSQGMKDAE